MPLTTFASKVDTRCGNQSLIKIKDGLGKSDAAMTMYKSTRFERIANFSMDFTFNAGENYNGKNELAAEMYYPAVALFVLLADKQRDNRLTLVVNTHLLYNNKKGHCKLGMLVLIFKAILKLQNDYQVKDTFFCGDFNSIPNSMLFSYIAHGKINLNVDLAHYSNQLYAIGLHGKRPVKDELRLQDYKFRDLGGEQDKAVKISPKFIVELANCDVEYGDNNRFVFKDSGAKGMTLSDAAEYFEWMSNQINFRSAYSQVNKELAQLKGHYKENKNYEEGITFFVTTMFSTVDYIWCASDELKANSVLQKPELDVLEVLPRTGPVGYFPSDHFCLFAEYVAGKGDK